MSDLNSMVSLEVILWMTAAARLSLLSLSLVLHLTDWNLLTWHLGRILRESRSDCGLLIPCAQNWHAVTYTILYWPTKSHSQPMFKKWKNKLHSLMERNSKLHWKDANIRKTGRLRPVFQYTVPHWEIYFIGEIVLFIVKYMIMKPTNKNRCQREDVYILLFQSSHMFYNVTSGSA